MKNFFGRQALAAALGCLLILMQPVLAQGGATAFTYQGQLRNNGNPATGIYDLTFTLFNVTNGGSAVAVPLTNSATDVTNGLFTALLDFGPGVFIGPSYWLEIGVRTNGGSNFTTLAPRQQLTPTPYAIYSSEAGAATSSTTAATANGVSAGSVTSAGIAAGQVVKSLNGLADVVTLSAGANVTITPSGNTLTVASTSSGGSGWSLTGNAGTTPGINFLGTTDNEPLELWVNDSRAFRLEPGNGSPNVIGGSGASMGSSVGGGTIAGGIANTLSNLYPTVGGGEYNHATANGAVVGGGYNNTASGRLATVSGGAQNMAQGAGAFVGGGGYDGSTLGGNMAAFPAATVAGGMGNMAGAYYAAIVGGYSNMANGSDSFVGGGAFNVASGFASVIPGGLGNTASGNYSFAAGDSAMAVHNGAFVWADSSSGIPFSSTSNNQFNVRAYGGVNFLTDGAGMTIDGASVVAGAGGSPSNSWLLTGNAGTAPGTNFLGTTDNEPLELHVNGLCAFRLEPDPFGQLAPNVIGGSSINFVESGAAGVTIAGGVNNYVRSNSFCGTIAGGINNVVAGDFSLAAGQQAQALHQGAFVWADSQAASFASTGDDQFCIRSQGGVQLDPSTSLFFGDSTRQMLNLYDTSYGIGVQNDDMYFRSADEFWWFQGGVHTNVFGDAGGGNVLMRLGSTGNLILSGTLTQNSDRNVKSGFQPVDARLVLEKIAAMPFTCWRYTNDLATPHIGPMAQDFYAAFAIGPDDKHITTIDESGVALAAIQGLNEKLEADMKEKDAQIERLTAKASQVDALQKRLSELEQMVQSLVAKKHPDP